jgi:hypothetical protein
MLRARAIHTEPNLTTRGDGIEEADALNVTAISLVAPVGDDDLIKRAFFCPAPGQSN